VPAKAPPPPPPVEDDPLDAMYDFAEVEAKAAPKAQVADAAARCPGCAAPLAPGAVLCVNCGYNLKTGAKVAASGVPMPAAPMRPGAARPLPSSKKPVDMMAPQGVFVVGLVLSAAFAVGGVIAGVGVSYLVYMWTGFDLFFFSIIIGVLAGVGMVMGQKGYSKLGGLTAAGISFVAILIARILVLLIVLLPRSHGLLASDSSTDASDYDDRVVETLTNENLKAAGVADPEDATDEQQESAEKAAVAKLKGMSKKDYDALVTKTHADADNDELVSMLADEQVSKTNSPTNDFKQYMAAMKSARKDATTKVAAMTDDQRKAELTRLRGKQEADAKALQQEAAANRAKSSGGSSSGEDSSSASRSLGIAAFVLLVLGLRYIIVTILAMGIAYRTAAGSVSG
jgi:hypothetical protein